jgi:hypothetical protein
MTGYQSKRAAAQDKLDSMDREEIIKLARKVGYPLVEYEGTPYIPPLLAVLLKAVATAQRPWVGLTDEDMKKSWYDMENIMGWYSFQEVARAIEAKLKERNA